MVDDGQMPRPKRLGDRRIAWDVRELDASVDQLSAEMTERGDETWSDIDAP
jgi:predicted DNA-binding transcriptional regulator AlpA